MPQDSETDPRSSNLSPSVGQTSNAIVTATVGALGDLAMSGGDPATALAMKAVAPMVGYVSEHGWQWLGRQAARIAEFSQRVRLRAEAEGTDHVLHTAADVVEQAVPIIGDAASEEKRRLIEDVVLAAAAGSREPFSRAAALVALEAIRPMSHEAAVVFGLILQNPRHSETGLLYHAEAMAEMWALPPAWVRAGAWDLSRIEPHALVVVEAEAKTPGGPRHSGNVHRFKLTQYGRWLADWITRNPAAKPDPVE